MCHCVSRLAFGNCEYNFDFAKERWVYSMKSEVCCVGFFVKYLRESRGLKEEEEETLGFNGL